MNKECTNGEMYQYANGGMNLIGILAHYFIGTLFLFYYF